MTTQPVPLEPVFEVTSPVSRSLPNATQLVGEFTLQFSSPLKDDDFEELARLQAVHPELRLRVYQPGERPPVRDLEFLERLPHLRRFQCEVFALNDFSGLRHLQRPAFLALGKTDRSLSLGVLTHLDSLTELRLEGNRKDIDVIGALRRLERLTLRSVTLPDLSVIETLPRLWWLAIKLGGTRDLSAARSLPLKYLEIWQVRGLADLNFVRELTQLQYLFLQLLGRVEALPSLARLDQLRRVHLEAIPLGDLRPLAEAPHLRELLLVAMKQLDPSSLSVLRGHPTLQAVGYGLGSMRRNDEARALLGLPDAAGGAFTFSGE
ncbi:MAG: hypothetical protein WD942_00820 [Dehalococcoidia bacterium]